MSAPTAEVGETALDGLIGSQVREAGKNESGVTLTMPITAGLNAT